MKTNKITELINQLDPNKMRCDACKKYKVIKSFPKVMNSFSYKNSTVRGFEFMSCVCKKCHMKTKRRVEIYP